MQSRTQSLIETTVSTTIGFVVALLTWYVVAWLWGMKVTMLDNLTITAIFTVVSVIRGYYIRRLFNWLHRQNGAD